MGLKFKANTMDLTKDLKLLILGMLLWIPLGITFLPLYLCFYIYSTVVHKLAMRFRPDLIPISKADAMMAFAPSYTDSSRVYTCQVWKVRGDIKVDTFRNHFYQCFLATEEDRRKYVNLYCYFVEYLGYVFKKKVASIDLKHHIRDLQLGQGETIEGFVGKWMVTHDIDKESDKERPVWQIRIISGLEDSHQQLGGSGGVVKGYTYVLFKLHHGNCDGYTIVHLAGKLCGEHAPYLFKEPVPTFSDKIKIFLQFPYLMVDIWIRMYIVKTSQSFVKAFSGRDACDITKDEWLISFCTLDLETVKQIRRVTRTNFVSVLMSLQLGVLRRLQEECCGEGYSKIKETYIGHSMGWPKHPVMTEGGGMTNHLTLNSIKASLSIDDPLERLINVDRNFQESKSQGYPKISYYIMFGMMKLQPGWFSRVLLNGDLAPLAVETVFSSLLCSPNQHYLLGNLVEHLYLPVVTPSLFLRMKLLTVPVSHSGILDISINASSALVKNQETLDRLTKVYFRDELEALKKRCQVLVE